MKIKQQYSYEESMINLDGVIDLIEDAFQNRQPLSLGRFGHGEIAYIGWSYFPHWTYLLEPHCSYSGATAPISTIKDEISRALTETDVVGFHASWGEAWEDRKTAELTLELLQHLEFKPKHVCSAFITHEMIKSEIFWKIIKGRKIALVGRRAAEACPAFEQKGIEVTYTTELEGYGEIEKVYEDLSNRKDWELAILSAGIPATILAPRLAHRTNRVVMDFGHALDKFIDGENFDYNKILRYWKEGINKRKQVSIVMAVFNGEEFLKKSIGSALAQTYSDLEMIIVNDGSTDSTKSILDAIDDKRVKVVHLEQNQGAANALNLGIREAKGEWIAIQDADDNYYPTKIEEQVRYIIEHPHLVGVGTFIEGISEDPAVSKGMLEGVAEKRNSFISRDQIRKKIFWGCPLTHSSVMFSKDIFWEVGGYNTDFKIAYDYDLWLRLLEKGEMENVPKVLLQYRIHTKSLSHNNGTITLNEIQLASSRAIYRHLIKTKDYQPRIIATGPQTACKNYRDNIAPASGLKLKKIIYDDLNKEIPKAVKGIKKGKLDAIIVLDGYRKNSILNYLKRNNLVMNRQVFNIYSY